MEQGINKVVDLAKEGDVEAIEWLIKLIQDRIYALAIKMLYLIPDAEDASQEILIKIVTRLGSFRKESSFVTWAMKIASNHLLNKQKSLARKQFTFKNCEDMIIQDMPDQSTVLYSEVEQGLLIDEMQIICVQGLFQCLDWDHRIVYILGATMDISSPEGSAILGITPVNFRKRFSRARKRIRSFLLKNCELFNEHNPCKCNNQSMAAINNGLINPENFQHIKYSNNKDKKKAIVFQLREMERLSREAVLIRIHPDYAAPEIFVKRIRKMLKSNKFKKLVYKN
ncbi:MAG: RNA polymerase sigma factor [Bacteroidetes bacterium]|nr:RNA polymerase sigma factor [Bacteroidota bacterium]